MLTYNFENRTAIVTGGSRGIGAATVKALLQAKATVVAVYSSNDEAANRFKESLGDLAANLTLAKLNVADYAQAEEFFRQFDEAHPTLDILVNSAGIRRDAVAAMMPEESWRSVIDVNLTSRKGKPYSRHDEIASGKFSKNRTRTRSPRPARHGGFSSFFHLQAAWVLAVFKILTTFADETPSNTMPL